MWVQAIKLNFDDTRNVPKIVKLANIKTTEDYLNVSIMKSIAPAIIGKYFIGNLSVEIVEELGYVVCSDPITNMFGTGDSLPEAIDDYRRVLLEFYEFLKNEPPEQLDESYKQALEYLEKVIT